MANKKLLIVSYILYTISVLCFLTVTGGLFIFDMSLDNIGSILGIGWMFYFLGLCSVLLGYFKGWSNPNDH